MIAQLILAALLAGQCEFKSEKGALACSRDGKELWKYADKGEIRSFTEGEKHVYVHFHVPTTCHYSASVVRLDKATGRRLGAVEQSDSQAPTVEKDGKFFVESLATSDGGFWVGLYRVIRAYDASSGEARGEFELVDPVDPERDPEVVQRFRKERGIHLLDREQADARLSIDIEGRRLVVTKDAISVEGLHFKVPDEVLRDLRESRWVWVSSSRGLVYFSPPKLQARCYKVADWKLYGELPRFK